MGMWRRLFSKKDVNDFAGAPATRRLKTYTSHSGYVYQYYYTGWRKGAGCKEYRFEWGRGGSNLSTVIVGIPAIEIQSWNAAHGRELSDSEQYGIAKMLLFKYFEELAADAYGNGQIRLAGGDLDRISNELGFESLGP